MVSAARARNADVTDTFALAQPISDLGDRSTGNGTDRYSNTGVRG
jgi:hypothetical protein